MSIIILPGIYEGSRDLKDRTKKLVFQTNEVTPEQAANLQQCVQNFVYLGIKKEDFTREEINLIDDLKTGYDDPQKTPAKRVRSILYLLWKQNSEGFETSEDHYKHHMEKIIEHLKNKLN